MKAWSQPEMEELNVRATAYSPKGGLIEDGVYQSDDGKYTIPTYGPSPARSVTFLFAFIRIFAVLSIFCSPFFYTLCLRLLIEQADSSYTPKKPM